MTTEDTTTATPVDVPIVVPEGRDFTQDLTIGELGYASRQLGADVIHACGSKFQQGAYRWDALAILAWMWARRLDRKADLDTYTAYTAAQLLHCLRADEEPDEPDELDEDVTANPMEPSPEDS